MAIAIARSDAGSVADMPPTVDAYTSTIAQRDVGVPGQHGEQHGDPPGVQVGDRPAWRAARGRPDHQRLHLGDQRPAPFDGDGDAGAGHGDPPF